MSLSETLHKYEEALTASSKRQEDLYGKRNDVVKEFYETFLNELIRRYDSKVTDPKWTNNLTSKAREFFKKNEISFLAVDGTCDKVPLEEYAVFFAASYGVRGIFSLDNLETRYVKRELKDELSMVAYVPIPFAELGEITTAELDDQTRFSNAEIHNRLMMLAELYLIYNELSSRNNPDVIIWDQSFSGMFHWVAPPLNGIPMVNNGYALGERKLTKGDALITRSHPFNDELDIPAATTGYFNLPSRIIYELDKSPNHVVEISQISNSTGESESEVRRVVEDFLEQYQILREKDEIEKLYLKEEYYTSWAFCVNLVNSICSRLFKEKDANAMVYENRWITTIDVDFMISVLIRATIEMSWKKKVILIGVVKDSASKYFTRNYLGVVRSSNVYNGFEPAQVFNLLWTDRLTLESLMEHDPSLNAPWASVEFDSVFQIVFLASKKGTMETLMRSVPTSERIFARSFALFFSLRKEERVTFNHLLFLDRVLIPELDHGKLNRKEITAFASDKAVKLRPFLDLYAKDENTAEDFVIFFLNQLTTNKFADVIGYPEPLHKADLGAKSFNKMVQPLIRSSTSEVRRSKPWLSSVRQKRRFR